MLKSFLYVPVELNRVCISSLSCDFPLHCQYVPSVWLWGWSPIRSLSHWVWLGAVTWSRWLSEQLIGTLTRWIEIKVAAIYAGNFSFNWGSFGSLTCSLLPECEEMFQTFLRRIPSENSFCYTKSVQKYISPTQVLKSYRPAVTFRSSPAPTHLNYLLTLS